MDSFLEEIYKDAMIIENLRCVIHESALCNGNRIMYYWNCARKRLTSFTERLGMVDLEYAKLFLECWREAAEGQNDFRVFSANIENILLPEVKAGLRKLYKDTEMTIGKWLFLKSETVFFTAMDKEIKRYIHSLIDPMYEAYLLAKKIYKIGLQRFHILGSGLGYLPYQIWEVSNHSVEIYIYEDDPEILQMAFKIGVLSWIEKADLHIMDCNEKEIFLDAFLREPRDGKQEKYISDYKNGAYKSSQFYSSLEQLDYNLRMQRSFGIYWETNKIKNLRLKHGYIKDLKKEHSLNKKEVAVVSAGPSLNDSIHFLRNNADRIGVIAVNTVLKRMVQEGIRPDYVAMLDPLPILSEHLVEIEDFTVDIPLVMPVIGSCSFAEKYRGPLYYLSEDEELKTDDFIWAYGGTVSSLALDIAYYLGAEKIYLIGNDLAYSGGKEYADESVHKEQTENLREEEKIFTSSNDGKKVQTTPLFNHYRKIIENQIQLHPDIVVINLSSTGAVIRGTRLE